MLHLRAECVDYAGVAMRFCQKCSRFHPLSAFEARGPACRRAALYRLRGPWPRHARRGDPTRV